MRRSCRALPDVFQHQTAAQVAALAGRLERLSPDDAGAYDPVYYRCVHCGQYWQKRYNGDCAVGGSSDVAKVRTVPKALRR